MARPERFEILILGSGDGPQAPGAGHFGGDVRRSPDVLAFHDGRPGSLFSDVPSYRRCEATMADLTGKVAIAKALARTGATAAVNCATGGKERNESYKTD